MQTSTSQHMWQFCGEKLHSVLTYLSSSLNSPLDLCQRRLYLALSALPLRITIQIDDKSVVEQVLPCGAHFPLNSKGREIAAKVDVIDCRCGRWRRTYTRTTLIHKRRLRGPDDIVEERSCHCEALLMSICFEGSQRGGKQMSAGEPQFLVV